MVRKIREGDVDGARRLAEILKPLFEVITVKTMEPSPYGPVACRARNPLATKTLMNLLGMPAGPCRRPLGRMTRAGLLAVAQAARKVHDSHPEILGPIEAAFGVNLAERLSDERRLQGLCYD
jgi:4-hydroxy-tetrahydrodipicolinate synthase